MHLAILDKTLKILEQPTCDHCLGRQFGQLLTGTTNAQRGSLLRTLAAMSIDVADYPGGADFSNFASHRFHHVELKKKPQRTTCSVCDDLFTRLERFVPKMQRAAKRQEFQTFLVGTKLSSELLTKEEALWERVGIEWCEPIKAELNREFGKLVEKNMNKRADTTKPNVCFLVNLTNERVSLNVQPLFIYGRYQKLVRGIPQTKWPSGKYKTSVEQIVAKPYMAATKGRDHKFHGAGREDVDARCLAWRPFVLEIIEPRRRSIELKKLAKRIGKQVRIKDVRLSDIGEVRLLKERAQNKTYRVTVRCSSAVTQADLKKLAALVGPIDQQTPVRVLHRRADRLRKKRVLALRARLKSSRAFELIVTCSAGLYVKELVGGDEGRTRPNVAAILNATCTPHDLDVIGIDEKNMER